MKTIPIPNFERARNYRVRADEQMEKTPEEQKEDFRDARYRLAFDLLFDAVRYAAMTFLVLDEQIDETFQEWRGKVSAFIDALEAR